MSEPANEEVAALSDEAFMPFAEFLMNCHPGLGKKISDLWRSERRYSNSTDIVLNTPPIRLHCSNDHCGGIRNFRSTDDVVIYRDGWHKGIKYTCSDCQVEQKFFSLHVEPGDKGTGTVTKFGEIPLFGAPVPKRMLRLFGEDSYIFLKGRRCENQGLGIGAFAYYRRVVEHKKSALFDEIINVCNILEAPDELISELTQARGRISFSDAIESIKLALPDALRIGGHNPLTLLHTALSRGLHNDSDEQCLELAHDIRVVLSELVARLAQLLKDDRDLSDAVKRLMKTRK